MAFPYLQKIFCEIKINRSLRHFLLFFKDGKNIVKLKSNMYSVHDIRNT